MLSPSDPHQRTFYFTKVMTYILAFYLTNIPELHRSMVLSDIHSWHDLVDYFILSDNINIYIYIYYVLTFYPTYIFFHFIWHTFWHSIWHFDLIHILALLLPFYFFPIQTAGLSSATASSKRQRRAKLNVQRQINRCPDRCFLLIHVKSLGIFWKFFKC